MQMSSARAAHLKKRFAEVRASVQAAKQAPMLGKAAAIEASADKSLEFSGELLATMLELFGPEPVKVGGTD